MWSFWIRAALEPCRPSLALWLRGRGLCAAPCHAKYKSRGVVPTFPSHVQVREGARRIARLEAALAEARARNPSIGASSPSRSAGGHATSREARLANEMQARTLPLALIMHAPCYFL